MENENKNNVEQAQEPATKKQGWFKKTVKFTVKYVVTPVALIGAGYIYGTDKWGVRTKVNGAVSSCGKKVKNLTAKNNDVPQVQQQGQYRHQNNNGGRPQYNKNYNN